MFKQLIIKNLQDGILLLAKYGLLLLVILYVFSFINNTYKMADNGNQAAVAINEYIKNGYLPAFPLTPKSNINTNK